VKDARSEDDRNNDDARRGGEGEERDTPFCSLGAQKLGFHPVTPCLPTTGSSLSFWIAGGLLIFAGLYILRYSRQIVMSLVVCVALGVVVDSHHFAEPAAAACSPDESSLLQGELRVEGGILRSSEFPLLTVTNGTSVLTARWGVPTTDGSDTVVSFAVPDITPGNWSVELTEGDATSFNLSSSSWSLVVNSSRLLTGGPFNATTSTPHHVSATGAQLSISVTRS
jgi:hypothetical protein